VAWRRHAHAHHELPEGDLGDEVRRAASYADQLQEAFCAYPGMEGLEVSITADRPPAGRPTEVHLDAVLVRPSAGALHHAEVLLRRPDGTSPWQQLLTPEEARHRMRAVLGAWAAET
jgi:hypothetical protein